MTLVIALRCNDGMVLASDGQATGNSAGGPIKHEFQKIFPIGERTLYGASGTIGMVQKSLDIIYSFSDELDRGLNIELRDRIRGSLFRLLRDAAEMHKNYYSSIDGAPLADVIIATTDRGRKHRIWHIGKDGNDELLDDMGYACTGAGDVFAYTLLKSFDPRRLELAKGKLLSYRIIKDAIDVGAYGLGGRISIWTIDGDGKILQSKEEEIAVLESTYLFWKDEERRLMESIELVQFLRN